MFGVIDDVGLKIKCINSLEIYEIWDKLIHYGYRDIFMFCQHCIIIKLRNIFVIY